jgi:intracellular septation protein
MKQLLEFIPIILFFIAFKLGDIYLATAVLMGATCVQMAIIYWMEKRLQVMQKITLYLILGFGALTLILHDDRFIKWKPTVLYTALALALALAVWIFKKNFLQLLLGAHLSLPNPVWMRLNIAWIVYFAFMSAANAFVVLQFSTEAWVNFKLWGYAFPIAFLIGQALYVSPYLKEEEKKE